MREHIAGYLIDPKMEYTSDFNYLYATTLKLVKLMGMEMLDPPKIVREEKPLKGNSVFCVIKTSHLAFHFMDDDNQKSRFTIDSCKKFNREEVLTFLENSYKCIAKVKGEF